MTGFSTDELPLDRLGLGVLRLRDNAELTIDSAGEEFYAMLGYRKGEIAALREPGPARLLQEASPVDWASSERRAGADGFPCCGAETYQEGRAPHLGFLPHVLRRKRRRGLFLGPCGRHYADTPASADSAGAERRAGSAHRQHSGRCSALPRRRVPVRWISSAKGSAASRGIPTTRSPNVLETAFIEIVYPQDREILLTRILGGIPWDNVMEITFRIVASRRRSALDDGQGPLHSERRRHGVDLQRADRRDRDEDRRRMSCAPARNGTG